MHSVITEHVALPVVAGREDDFEATFAQARTIIESMPGFLRMTLSRSVESPSSYLLLVDWERLEDHTVGFRQSPEFARWRELLHHFYDSPPDVEHFRRVA